MRRGRAEGPRAIGAGRARDQSWPRPVCLKLEGSKVRFLGEKVCTLTGLERSRRRGTGHFELIQLGQGRRGGKKGFERSRASEEDLRYPTRRLNVKERGGQPAKVVGVDSARRVPRFPKESVPLPEQRGEVDELPQEATRAKPRDPRAHAHVVTCQPFDGGPSGDRGQPHERREFRERHRGTGEPLEGSTPARGPGGGTPSGDGCPLRELGGQSPEPPQRSRQRETRPKMNESPASDTVDLDTTIGSPLFVSFLSDILPVTPVTNTYGTSDNWTPASSPRAHSGRPDKRVHGRTLEVTFRAAWSGNGKDIPPGAAFTGVLTLKQTRLSGAQRHLNGEGIAGGRGARGVPLSAVWRALVQRRRARSRTRWPGAERSRDVLLPRGRSDRGGSPPSRTRARARRLFLLPRFVLR
jgi:hypothetical protein